MIVLVDLTNSWEKKKRERERERSEKQRKKGKIYPNECRVPETSEGK